MSGLIDTALGWWRHNEPRGDAHDDADAGAGSNGKATDKELGIAKPIVLKPAVAEPAWLTQLDRLGIPRSLVYPTTTLGRLLDQTADRFGSATAIIYNHRTWTWQEVREQSNRLAGGLARLGVRRGD